MCIAQLLYVRKKGFGYGGATGIGRAIALALVQAGADVAVASRNPDPQIIKEIKPLAWSSLVKNEVGGQHRQNQLNRLMKAMKM